MTTVLLPVTDEPPSAIPGWVSQTGGRVRGFDLRRGWEVYGASHAYRVFTDMVISNGLVRFRPGPRLGPPYLVVQAFADGAWRDVGCLNLAAQTAGNILLGARCVQMSRESATVVLDVSVLGQVYVRLHRGRRELRITHGSTIDLVIASRFVGWSGGPPAAVLTGASVETAVFGKGLRLAAGGVARYYWPKSVSSSLWTLGFWWLPDAASTSQPDSGLLSFQDPAGTDVVTLSWQASTKTLRWVQGGVTLATAALTFGAAAPVFVGLRFDATSGRSLSTYIGSTLTSVADATVAPGASAYGFLSLGQVGAVGPAGGAFGDGNFGDGYFGGDAGTTGGVLAGGPLDNALVFIDRLTDAEVLTLAAEPLSLSGLPLPESRLAWHGAFDAAPVSSGPTLTNGGTSESVSQHGLTKGLAIRNTGAAKGEDLSVTYGPTIFGGPGTTVFDVGAFCHTAATADTLSDLVGQYHAESHQELRVR